MYLALVNSSWVDEPLAVIIFLAFIAFRIWLASSGYWGSRGWSILGGYYDGADENPYSRVRVSNLPSQHSANPAAAAQPQTPLRQSLDGSTGEITTQDLDDGAPVVPAGTASSAAGQPTLIPTDAERLMLLREQRARVRQQLPEIAAEMLAQWRNLATSLHQLERAAQADPGSTRLPPSESGREDAAAAANMATVSGAGGAWVAGAGAGPLQLSPERLRQHDFIDRNHNGIPDELEAQPGGDYAPLTFSERAWRGVLESDQGPGVLLVALQKRLQELYAAQALVGLPLRLQGPIEEVHGIVTRAFAACDERVQSLQRMQLRGAVLNFIEQDLPRTCYNIEQAAWQLGQRGATQP